MVVPLRAFWLVLRPAAASAAKKPTPWFLLRRAPGSSWPSSPPPQAAARRPAAGLVSADPGPLPAPPSYPQAAPAPFGSGRIVGVGAGLFWCAGPAAWPAHPGARCRRGHGGGYRGGRPSAAPGHRLTPGAGDTVQKSEPQYTQPVRVRHDITQRNNLGRLALAGGQWFQAQLFPADGQQPGLVAPRCYVPAARQQAQAK